MLSHGHQIGPNFHIMNRLRNVNLQVLIVPLWELDGDEREHQLVARLLHVADVAYDCFHYIKSLARTRIDAVVSHVGRVR